MGLNLASPGHGYSNWSPTLPKTHTLPLKTGNIQKNNRGSACFMGELVVLPSIFSLKTGDLLSLHIHIHAVGIPPSKFPLEPEDKCLKGL